MRSIVVGLGAALVVVVACTKVESSSLKTSGMSALMNVTADGTGKTVASAALHVDVNATDFVDLSPGDTLSASSGSNSQTMSRNDVLGIINYTADFSGLDAADTPYKISFMRSNDTSAPSSTCTMPIPFSIKTPSSTASFSRTKDDVTITWDLTGKDPMTYEASGACSKAITPTSIASDTGAITIAKGALGSSDPAHANDNCQVTVIIKRTRAGQLDSAFGHGGNITAMQQRSITFATTP